ncbi:predicted protein [Histoplasma capsulatum G186AR]|uniref:Uncharacterized protein n=2 Tax=Ajellomyces capsulatus TaxID=5037 RepID=C0NWY4_AJECG|nr:uncharacterized protein HCBG_07976 [Histoplasma capsulatum G186AR]EEH03850.1 predicted protein [Histoplasma capsulatum G186AR]
MPTELWQQSPDDVTLWLPGRILMAQIPRLPRAYNRLSRTIATVKFSLSASKAYHSPHSRFKVVGCRPCKVGKGNPDMDFMDLSLFVWRSNAPSGFKPWDIRLLRTSLTARGAADPTWAQPKPNPFFWWNLRGLVQLD